jgi:PAS domain S-box-containing protein
LVFKEYARYLLEKKLPEASAENLKIVRDLDLPLLRLFAHLPEEELLALIRQSLEQFLRQITLGQAWEAATATLLQWKADQLPGIPRQKVEASDIILSYSARKQLFVSFLPAYTQDARLITALLLELERFYLKLEQEAFRVYGQIQQQELRSANEKLQESQEELQAANEELQAINEEFQATNEELLDQISRRAAAEEGLRESERRFRLLAQNATDIISTHDLEGTFTYISPSVENTLGYTPEEITGRTPYGFFHPEDLEHVAKKHRQILEKDHGSGVYTFRFRNRQGAYVWLESSVRAIRDSLTDKLVEIQVTSRDVSRRKSTEQLLEQERQYLKVILETISDGIVACGADGILSYFNPATRELHGLPEQMLPPEQWAEHYSLHHPDGRLMQPEEIPLLRALRGEVVRQTEMVIAPAQGKRRILLASGNQILSAEGNVLGAVVSMHDITEQKEAEQALVRLNRELKEKIEDLVLAKEQLKELNETLEGKVQARTAELAYQKEWLLNFFMQVPALIGILKGPERVVELFNAEFTKLWGHRDVLGKTMRQAWPELEGQGYFEIMEQVYHTGQPVFGDEYPGLIDRNNDGTLHQAYFNFVYAPLNNPQGETEGVIIYGVDVTEQVEARRKIERSEESLRLALEAGKMGTWHLDLVRDESTRSLQHDQIFGYDHLLPEWGYARFMEHVVPEDRERVAASFEQAAEKGELSFQARIIRADQRFCWIAVRGQVFYGPGRDGESRQPLRMAGVVMDITAQKQAEEALQGSHAALEKKNEELEKINADLDNFIYIISHDLKTPVVNLEGLVMELRHELGGKADAEALALVDMVESSTARFKKTLQDLTHITRFQKEQLLKVEQLSFRHILDEVKTLLKPSLLTSAVEFEEQLAEDTVLFDRKSLVSVFQNLLTNAIKYRSPDRRGKVTIKTSRVDGHTLLEVRDNGLGLTPEQQAKVFDLFRRFHPHVEGSGMGLYIVKKIMDRHQGRIEVESEKGEHTSFKLYFNQKHLVP